MMKAWMTFALANVAGIILHISVLAAVVDEYKRQVGTRIFGQSLLKHLLGLDVQMIGRFIQNQEIGRMQKHAHQRHAGAVSYTHLCGRH